MADQNRNKARISETEEGSAEIKYSDSEESSIDAFKRIRFDKWASDIRKGQDKLYEYLRYPYRVEELAAEEIDPNEERYCICGDVSFGNMIYCENENVSFNSAFYAQLGVIFLPIY